MLSESDKVTLKNIERLTAELVEMKHNIKPKVTDSAIINSMLEHNNNKSRVAKSLGVTYKTIYRRWKKLSYLNTNPKVNVSVPVPEAFEIIRKFINREKSEFEDKEDYSALSRCYDASEYLDKLVKFFDDACDYCL